MVNHLVFQGRLVDDPKFGTTNSGTEFANFRMVWSRKYKEKETKCFLECKAFSGTAKFMQNYMNRKGQELIAEGEMTTEEWDQDGQKRSKNVFVVSGVHFSGKKPDGETASAQAGNTDSAAQLNMTEVETDELPF